MMRSVFILGFLLIASLGHAQQLQRGEYFFDTDPGFGNATAITFTTATQVDMQLPITVSGLAPGGHILGIRMKDNAGNWGLTNRRFFFVTAASAQELQRGEYYFDVDPGFGNGTGINFTQATEVSLPLSLDVSALAPGAHVLGVRMMDDAGHWGLTNRRFFMVRSMAPGGDVVRFEYFLDVDPGFGNGTIEATNAAPNIIDQLFDVLTDTVSNGPHTLFVRAKSSSGAWSLTNAFPFNVVVGIEELLDLGITAGPNPMSDRLVLRRAAPGNSITLHLMDALGRHLHQAQWSDDRFEFDTNELSSGTYVLVLWVEGRPPGVLKLSKP